MLNLMQRFVREDEGLETVEYAIITGLVVSGVIAVIAAIGAWVYNQFNSLKTDIGA